MANIIDIGKQIKAILKQQNKSVSWLARKLNTNRTYVYRIFKKQSIDTEVLRQISIILKHDFFSVYSKDIAENPNKKVDL